MKVATTQEPPHDTGERSSRPHFTGFEALRAVAACMVVLHHASSITTGVRPPAAAGIVESFAAVFDSGVAIFFVLSGFLLWWPVVDRSIRGWAQEPLLGFWWRRVLRIVPAYWLALSVLWALGVVHLGDDAWRYYLFLQVYAKETILGGIVVAWSLCTEMAFYLLLPFLGRSVSVLARRTTARGRIPVHLGFCAALWLVGILSRLAVDRWWPEQRGLAFTWLPQNLDLFATGMALAVLSVAATRDDVLRARLDRIAAHTGAWWLAAIALFSWYALRVGPAEFATGYRGLFWQQRQILLAIVTVLLLVPVVFGTEHGGTLRRMATARPVVWVGLVSYGLYLWHLDLLSELVDRDVLGLRGLLVRGSDPAPMILFLGVIGFGGGLALAAVSWYGVERPLQRFRHVADPRSGRFPTR